MFDKPAERLSVRIAVVILRGAEEVGLPDWMTARKTGPSHIVRPFGRQSRSPRSRMKLSCERPANEEGEAWVMVSQC